MIPSTVDRVPLHTSASVNQQIRCQTESNVTRVAQQGPQAITRRLEELDEEWDIERILEVNASTACLTGLALGATVDKRFFLVPVAVAAFLMQHAVQGWCPPLPLFRRLGFRTQSEIEKERYALKVLRGDFRTVEGDGPRNAARAADAMTAIDER